MYGSTESSKGIIKLLSAIAHEAYLKDIANRASCALQPMTNRRIILVAVFGDDGLYQCYVREVRLNLPNDGYLIAIPLNSKP